MQHTGKILILGAALTGLGIAGAGTAVADRGDVAVPPAAVASATGAFSTDWPFDDFDDLFPAPPRIPGHHIMLDDDWDEWDEWDDD